MVDEPDVMAEEPGDEDVTNRHIEAVLPALKKLLCRDWEVIERTAEESPKGEIRVMASVNFQLGVTGPTHTVEVGFAGPRFKDTEIVSLSDTNQQTFEFDADDTVMVNLDADDGDLEAQEG